MEDFYSVIREIYSSSWAALVSVLAIAVVCARVFRGLVAPSLAWDDLTYHLFRAGRWVIDGGWHITAAPNAWGYSEYFPPVGDALWAWALLPSRNSGAVVGANLLVLSLVAIAMFAGARRLARRHSIRGSRP